MKSIEVVFNPNAGRGRAVALATHLVELLVARGWRAQASTIADFLTPGGAIERASDLIVALGGDGTVRAIVEGLAARFAEASPPVAVLAMGTANLVARHLDLPWSDRAGLSLLIDAIEAGNTRAVDVPAA